MALKLHVTSYGSQPMGAAADHLFDESGGSIGRATNNDWCLPDPECIISNTHAFIRYANGEFYFRDNSTNGSFLNTLQLSKGDERPLRSGDHLKIGMYEISVEDTGQTFEMPQDSSGRQVPSLGDLPPNLEVDPVSTLDPLKLLGAGSDQSSMNLPPEDFDFSDQRAQPDNVSPQAMGFEPPTPIPDPNPMPVSDEIPGDIPEKWDETGIVSPASAPAPPPVSSEPNVEVAMPQSPAATASQPSVRLPPHTAQSRASPGADDHGSVAALLEAAGLRPEAITNETYAMLGQILQVVVQGTVDLLRARAQIKDQFRVPATMLKPVENNPLKFSINAQDALHNLFGKSNPGFRSPVDAFDESYEDIKAHQIAMIAGMRSAYQAMLEYFNPDDLQADFDRALKRGVLGGVLNKTKYWDLYEDLYKSLSRDPDSSFHKLFGNEFGRAYEEQMQRLSTVRK